MILYMKIFVIGLGVNFAIVDGDKMAKTWSHKNFAPPRFNKLAASY